MGGFAEPLPMFSRRGFLGPFQNKILFEVKMMMRRLSVSLCALVFLMAAMTGSSMAQDNSWNGSWKADPATYKYMGPTYSIATDDAGYTVTRGGKATPKIVCDGKPQKTSANEMTTCVKAGSGYTVTLMRDGKQVRKGTSSISADGKTRTIRSEVTPPDGTAYTTTTIAKRVSGGPGTAGEWKEVSTKSSSDKGILSIAVKGDSIDFKETDNDKAMTCKLDGSPTKFAGGTMSVKLADPHTLKVMYSGDDGKVRRENTFVLSADGKMITETDVTPDPSPSTMTVMFHKQ